MSLNFHTHNQWYFFAKCKERKNVYLHKRKCMTDSRESTGFICQVIIKTIRNFDVT